MAGGHKTLKPKRRFRQTQLSAEPTGKPDRAIGATDLRRLRVSLTRESCVLAAVLAAVLVAVLAAVLSLALPLYCFSAFLITAGSCQLSSCLYEVVPVSMQCLMQRITG